MKRLTSEKPMTLSRDPQQMLEELASYLENVTSERSRRVVDPDCPASSPLGYWQTPEWIDGLRDLASELRTIQGEPPRVALAASAHDLLLRAAESIGLTDPPGCLRSTQKPSEAKPGKRSMCISETYSQHPQTPQTNA